MIPYPIEEMRKFILKEYPNLNNMLHHDYKAGALMSAILRWWTDEQQPEIENLRNQVAVLKEIAVELKAEEIYPYKMPTWDHLPEEDFQKKILGTEIYREYPGKKEYRNAANRMLAEERPEAFR